jgi:hypothetical protein
MPIETTVVATTVNGMHSGIFENGTETNSLLEGTGSPFIAIPVEPMATKESTG